MSSLSSALENCIGCFRIKRLPGMHRNCNLAGLFNTHYAHCQAIIHKPYFFSIRASFSPKGFAKSIRNSRFENA